MNKERTWKSLAQRETVLAARRAHYKKTKAATTSEELTEDAREIAAELKASTPRDKRLKVWQFCCNSGLRLNTGSLEIEDYKVYFETGDDPLAGLSKLDNFGSVFWRVSVDADLLRGVLRLTRPTTMGELSKLYPWLDFFPATISAARLSAWVVAHIGSGKLSAGKIRMQGNVKFY